MTDNTWPDEPNDDLYQQVEHLVLDPLFRAWVLRPTPESEAYWIDYLSLGLADREQAVRQARLIVLALQMPEYAVSEAVVDEKTNQFLRRIRAESATPVVIPFVRSSVWRWAAAAVLLLSLGWWAFSAYRPAASHRERNGLAGQVALPGDVSGTIVEETTVQTPRRVQLPDGSTVTLQPHSRLRYDKVFTQANRTVTLSGQAFFEVTHNPKRPFLVFTDEVVTRVLGTSFTITTRQGQPAIVSVRTGRVAVYTRQAFAQASQRPQETLLLTPNQQATFDKKAGELTKKLVAQPLPIPTEVPNTLNFENRPVTEVIAELEKIYGVRIACNHDQLSQCRVTVLLENEPLYDQLSLLCKLIDGQYQLTGTTVTLTANGCS